jgi:putative flippase GtrA
MNSMTKLVALTTAISLAVVCKFVLNEKWSEIILESFGWPM